MIAGDLRFVAISQVFAEAIEEETESKQFAQFFS